ncbi:VWA domain-containing protein [Enterococcus faecalis]|uniref:VWA domain-containing protein n=1 Tax=Enterococcus faecalis TaxID=1351 RepID=UPI0031379A34
MKEDTDGDGVEDGLEVEIGTNPLVKEETFSRELTVDPQTLTDSRVIPTIQLEQLSSTQVQDMAIREVGTEHPFFSETIPGYLGSAFEFYVPGTFSNAKMTFTFDSSLATGDNFLPTIYYYNEEKQLLEEVPNQQIVGNTVQTTVQHFSTYLLLNKKEFDAVWNDSILPPEEQNTGVDIVFVVDESSSMLENDPKNIRIDVIRRFLTQVREQDRVSIVGFNASARTYCSLTNDRPTIEKALDSIQSNRWGTDGSKGLKQGIDQLGNDRYKRLIFLTDGEDTTQTYSYDQLIQEANEKNIMIHTVGLGSDVQTAQLEHVAQGTKGQYFFAENADALYQEYDEIYQEIDRLKKDDNQDGILDYYMKELFEKRLVFGNGQTIYDFFALDPAKVNYELFQQTNDFDQDGLINGQELTIRVEKNQSRTRVYADITTSPFDKDSSGDGTQDGDGTGLKWQVGKRDLALFAKLSYTSLDHWQKQYFDNGQPHLIYKDDKNDGDFDLFAKYGDSLEVRHKNHWVRDKELDTDTMPISDNKLDNFNASAYINKRDKQVVLAYRGTTSGWDWLGNILWLDGSHVQEISSRIFAKRVARKYSNYIIYITGHSLGGYLAMIGSDTLSNIAQYDSQLQKTIVFNSLGVSKKKNRNTKEENQTEYLRKKLIESLTRYANSGRIETYRVEYDVVSKIGIHFGQQSPAIQWNKNVSAIPVLGPHEMGNFISVWSENSRNPAQIKQFYSKYSREEEVPCQN